MNDDVYELMTTFNERHRSPSSLAGSYRFTQHDHVTS